MKYVNVKLFAIATKEENEFRCISHTTHPEETKAKYLVRVERLKRPEYVVHSMDEEFENYEGCFKTKIAAIEFIRNSEKRHCTFRITRMAIFHGWPLLLVEIDITGKETVLGHYYAKSQAIAAFNKMLNADALNPLSDYEIQAEKETIRL